MSEQTTAPPEDSRPIIVVSQCLGFAAVRYNGAIIEDDFVQLLARHVDVIEVCPEVAIGLGVPRDPIRLQQSRGSLALVQPATERDITAQMQHFAADFLYGLARVDGFILKSRSPSCGTTGVSIFADDSATVLATGAGMFAAKVMERHHDIPVVDELQLRDHDTRDHFLTTIFALARFRYAVAAGSRAHLVAFQSRYKYLLMAHSPEGTVALGRIAAAPRPSDGVGGHERMMHDYGARLRETLVMPPTRGGHVNALHHMLGHISGSLSRDEKINALSEIEEYRRGDDAARHRVTAQIRRAALASGDRYLGHQAYFDPYPSDLAILRPVP